MKRATTEAGFAPLNRAFDRVFRPGWMSLGLVVPIESYPTSDVPEMTRHVERVELAERLGFGAVWLRDVPLRVPSFGDAGQTFDPFVYLGLLAGRTERIALGVASVVLPLRHPIHVAKAAASADVLSGGRVLLGVASGDRPDEYPALARSFPDRGSDFRAAFETIRRAGELRPVVDSRFGRLDGRFEVLPRPTGPRLPLLVTGSSRQDPDWIAQNADGWMVYPRPASVMANVADDWRARLAAIDEPDKPLMQPLYVDLDPDPAAPPSPIHLGLRAGARALVQHLESLQAAGVNHVALNLRFQRHGVENALQRLASDVLPRFIG